MPLADGDPGLRPNLGCVAAGVLDASMMIGGGFGIAPVNAALADAFGLGPVDRAPIPMPTLSRTPRIGRKLARLGWPSLGRLFGVDALLAEVKLVMFERGGRMQRPKLPTTTPALELETLRAEVVEAHRRFDAIVRQLGHLKA